MSLNGGIGVLVLCKFFIIFCQNYMYIEKFLLIRVCVCVFICVCVYAFVLIYDGLEGHCVFVYCGIVCEHIIGSDYWH